MNDTLQPEDWELDEADDFDTSVDILEASTAGYGFLLSRSLSPLHFNQSMIGSRTANLTLISCH